MSIKITIYDGAIPLLDEIAKQSYGLGLDALDQAGIELRDQTRRAFKSFAHEWSQEFSRKSGKMQIKKGYGNNPLGLRKSHTTGRNFRPKNMSNFITSFLMEKNMTLVVAGMHKSFRPKKRRDGKVQGTLSKVGGVSNSSLAIIRKLNDGNENDADYKKVRPESMPRFKNANYKKRNFIEKGRALSMPKVRNIMTTKLENMIARQVNRTDVKVRKFA